MITLCALAVSLPCTLALPASQTSARGKADLKELSTYTLSVDTLNKVDRAIRSFAVEIKKDPRYAEATRLEAEMKALEKKFQEQETEPSAADQKRLEAIEARLDVLKDDGSLKNDDGSLNMSDAHTISDMAAKIQKQPALASALQLEGMTVRDFAKFTMALLQAGLAAGLQKAGMLKETPEGTNPANIKWILEHEAELAKLQKAWGGA